MLPDQFFEDLLELLQRYPHLVRFRTCDALRFDAGIDLSQERGLQRLFDDEYTRHRHGLKRDTPCDIFLMHDTDSGPAQTLLMADVERRLGVRSTISTFARVRRGGGLAPYDIDFARLAKLQDEGFVFGYHSNAYENANFDERRAAQLFEEDVAELERRGLKIDYFSPHGGRRGPGGLVNGSIYWPGLIKRRLIWSHNFHAPLGARYSDGAAAARLEAGDPTLDLRAQLLKNLARESRYFILLHPQYYFYDSGHRFTERFAANPWLGEYWRLYEKGRAQEFWEPLASQLEALTARDSATAEARRISTAPPKSVRQKRIFDPPYRYIGIRIYRRLKARLFPPRGA